MGAARWMLVLVAVGSAAAAALWWAPSGPAASPTPQATAVAALPLNLPAPASAAAASGGGALAATPPAPAPSPAAGPPAPRIGSEGYGPYIDRALAGNDAAAAWEAMQWLQLCASNADRRSSFEHARDGGVSPELLTQLMQEADAEGRRCQTVTARHQAMRAELALRAMRGDVREAAATYAGATPPGDLAPALRQEVLDALRRDALAGHAGSLFGAIVAPEAWGLGDAERLGYLFAYGELTGRQGRDLSRQLAQQNLIRFKAAPTAEQMAAAQAAGQQIVAELRARP